jgi:transcriptional regulator of acetoin/glycerol metabolism
MNQVRHRGESIDVAVRHAQGIKDDLETATAGPIPSVIELSWQRCLGYGLDRGQHQELDLLERSLLADQKEKSRQLLSHAQPVMDSIFAQIIDTQDVLVLSNDTGHILHSFGWPSFLKQTEKVALSPGVDWSEAKRGTNAIGTAIILGSPVMVTGREHFLSIHQSLTCSASPIFDPYGCLTGILDLTGDHHSFNRHSMALVRMAVKMIENRMFEAAFNGILILHFHARPELVGTPFEGMAAFDEDGCLSAANQNACVQLDKGLDQLKGKSFAALFGHPISRLYDHLMVRSQDPMILRLGSGAKVLGRANFHPQNLRKNLHLASKTMISVTTPKPPSDDMISLAAYSGPDLCSLHSLERLRTGDPQIDIVVSKVKKIIGRDIPILIQGETGTGKEILAHAIHNASSRAAKPFIPVNCAAIPEGLIESELFGYEGGAFTGARSKGNIGRIVQANGGTLFLDEIGDMPLSLQGRLLRTLEERVVVPLGSVKSYPVDITVICATHRQLRELIKAGRFREDLYYRINGLTVQLPPLRKRTDLSALISLLLNEFGGIHSPTLAPEVIELFRHHSWPGNLRQLSNLLRTAVIMADDSPTIRREHLSDDFIEDIDQEFFLVDTSEITPRSQVTSTAIPAPPPFASPLEPENLCVLSSRRLQDLALQAIQNAITRNAGNISAAARELGISRCTLYRKLRN